MALRRMALWAMLGLSAVLAGCASSPGTTSRDPFETFNRSVTRFNDGADEVVLKPAATAYRAVAPPMVRTGVSNFFGNLNDAWSVVNNLLQFKLQHAAEMFIRVNMNTFIGLGGVLDVASEFNMERHKEDFGQTLGRWGVPAGPYVVLPLLGPSTVRDAAAFSLDRQGDLVRGISPTPARNATYILRGVDVRSNLLRASTVLDEVALDKYSFTRDVFLQRRRAEMYDGDPPDLPSEQARPDQK
jgi:phospholipid-binding lipoprotein MlaA